LGERNFIIFGAFFLNADLAFLFRFVISVIVGDRHGTSLRKGLVRVKEETKSLQLPYYLLALHVEHALVKHLVTLLYCRVCVLILYFGELYQLTIFIIDFL
jgi:hypothetical protein